MRIDDIKLPLPTKEELTNYRKWMYNDRMWKEESDKYNITPGEFSVWVSRTYNEVALKNKHITYRESLKLI